MKIQNFINGKFEYPISNEWIDNFNPCNGEVYGHIPNSSKKDVDNANKAAMEAFPIWSQTTLEKRSRILIKISELLEANLKRFAEAESKDNGKPISLAKTIDIPRAANNFRFFGNAITQFASESHESVGQDAINYTLRQPIGIVGCISPWNLPLYLFTWKIAPAIAAGNCVVAKPSEVTPMTAYLLGEILTEAGLPKGVLNIVHGTGPSAGQAIVEHPNIKAISFTGGTKTGISIAQKAAEKLMPVSLELGGKSPTIVFEDCDQDVAVAGILFGIFSSTGQSCIAGSRLFIQKSIYDSFLSKLIEATENLITGHPHDPNSQVAPLVHPSHRDSVAGFVGRAIDQGGKILTGGKPPDDRQLSDGSYFLPTIVSGLSNQAEICREEVFGPVLVVLPFDDEADVITQGNDNQYGLACGIWSADFPRCWRVARAIQAGTVWINTYKQFSISTPFGGDKQSGVGREKGRQGILAYMRQKSVYYDLSSAPHPWANLSKTQN